MEKSFTNKN